MARRTAISAGWIVAFDGRELRLIPLCLIATLLLVACNSKTPESSSEIVVA